MLVNAVAPWEGTIAWVGQPKEGTSQKTGNAWKMVDFTLKWINHQMQEKYIVFSLSGAENVNKLLQMPLGAQVRVNWTPDANQFTDSTGAVKWFPKFNATAVNEVRTPMPTQQVPQPGPQYGNPKPTYGPTPYPAPAAPQQPAYGPQYGPQYQQQSNDPFGDLPM